MYVFLSEIFCKLLLTPILKKLDAFIPALSLLLRLFVNWPLLFCVSTKRPVNKQLIPTPVCFFLLYYSISNNMYVTQNYFPSSQKSTIKITSFFITRSDIMKPRK